MRRFIVYPVLLALLLGLSDIVFSQSQSNYFDQEQALTIAHEIVKQKAIVAESDLDNLSVQIPDLIDEGHMHWADLEFDQAKEKFEQALRLQPNDPAIATLIYSVELAGLKFKRRQAEMEKQIIQEKRMLETEKAWLAQEPTETQGVAKRIKPVSDKLKAKAAAKVLSLDFSNAQLRKVFEYLSKTSGINIVIDEAAVANAGNISIHLNNVTLLQALESIFRTKGLGFRFEDNFVWISTKENIKNESLVTRIYHLSQGLATFTTFTTFDTVTIGSVWSDNKVVLGKDDESNSKEASPTRSVTTFEGVKIGGSSGVAGKITITIREVLREIIDWPEGSSIFLDNRTSTLIVRNTPSNLAIIEQALEVLDVNPPQVMIEARFVEIGEHDLLSLGLKLSPEISATGAASPTTYPFNKDQNTKYASAFPTTTAADFTFGRLDFSQFQAVISAIEQNKNSNTLSSPKITTISGQEAIIKIVKEYRYPTKYDIQTFTIVDTDGVERTESFPVPADFKTRDIGIILKVTPNVGADRKTINLILVPEVSEFDIDNDMFNYGTDDNPYLQPFFNVRNATASIIVNNNDTVVMGGLMREVVEHTVDRVPILGRFPIIGNLFSRKYDSKQKRNLLIFVTARIIAPTGQTVQAK